MTTAAIRTARPTIIRRHDTVLADGTFTVTMTRDRRVFATLKAKTALGSVRILVELQRPVPAHEVGFLGDFVKSVSRAAEGAFNKASKAVTTVVRPVFNVAKGAAAHGLKAIAAVAPLLPKNTRNQIAAAARTVLRARLGDVTAKQFLRGVANAAKAGVQGAMKAAGHILEGGRLLQRAMNLPAEALKQLPGVGNVIKQLDPMARFDRMVDALKKGDVNALKKLAQQELATAQAAMSLVPGVGTGISSAIGTGLALLNGGKPLEIALQAAYGAIPIPPGVRNFTDMALAAVLELMRKGSITDVAVAAARDRIPPGLPRDVFDTLIRIVIKKMPIQRAGAAMLDHYVRQYGGKLAAPVAQPLMQFAQPAMRQVSPLLRTMQQPAAAAAPFNALSRMMRVGEDPSEYEVSGETSQFELAGDFGPFPEVAGAEGIAPGCIGPSIVDVGAAEIVGAAEPLELPPIARDIAMLSNTN
jgi:hypothetical protein